MRVQDGGAGDPVLLLLHGLGATSDVWNGVQPLLAGRWPGRWLAPDLPGHGGSDRLDRYTFDTFAAALAELVDATARVVVIGHSMGGAVGINLASGGFGVDVAGVVGFGIKVSWAPEELERARALSQRPVTWFDTRDEAADRYLRISGLSGRWRLALDPPAFGVGAPDMPRLLAQAKAPVLLARGEHDQLVSHGQLAALVADPVSLPGLGHNAHVEDPAAVIGLLDRIAL
jgi:pimeloyl-ACP methyl ester carboxylesterase